MNIYLASSPVFRTMSLGKIGCTKEPYGRRSNYLTGCPPGLIPSYDIDYDGVWETMATTEDELVEYEDEVIQPDEQSMAEVVASTESSIKKVVNRKKPKIAKSSNDD
jgi:hypothetical protein